MKIIVTGALGHIGSRLVRELPARYPHADVIMIDSLATERYCSLFNLPAGGTFRFVEADVLTVDLDPMVAGADVVVHLAAITDATNSFSRKAEVEYVNFNTTAAVARACAKAGVPMIHLSSTSVYGTQAEVVDESCPPEDLQPQSPYAEIKLKEEEFLRATGAEHGLQFVTCRFGTICGISPGMRFHTAVNKFCWQAAMGLPLTVWRTALHQKRPYLTMDDAMAALFMIVERRLFDRSAYNVVTDNLTVSDIVTAIRQHTPELQIELVDSPVMNQLSYEVSGTRFAKRGFRASGSVVQCIAETVLLLRPAAGSPVGNPLALPVHQA